MMLSAGTSVLWVLLNLTGQVPDWVKGVPVIQDRSSREYVLTAAGITDCVFVINEIGNEVVFYSNTGVGVRSLPDPENRPPTEIIDLIPSSFWKEIDQSESREPYATMRDCLKLDSATWNNMESLHLDVSRKLLVTFSRIHPGVISQEHKLRRCRIVDLASKKVVELSHVSQDSIQRVVGTYSWSDIVNGCKPDDLACDVLSIKRGATLCFAGSQSLRCDAPANPFEFRPWDQVHDSLKLTDKHSTLLGGGTLEAKLNYPLSDGEKKSLHALTVVPLASTPMWAVHPRVHVLQPVP